MKLKYKFLLCVCLIFLIGTIEGCEKSQDTIYDDHAKMYDDNAKIAQDSDNYSYRKSTEPKTSNDQIEMSYGIFSGTDTIWVLEAKEDCEITFNYDSTVNNGDFKAVLINPQKEIENIVEGTAQGDKTIKLIKGKYRFKFVGRNAGGKVKISINENKNVTITKSDKR